MMMEDSEVSKHMRLPHPGIGAKPRTEVQPNVELPMVAPTLESPCRNLWESVGWWKGVQEDAKMRQGDNNIALSLNVDGFQPFTRGGLTLHPFVFQVLNLPENIRIRNEYMILAALVPGKKAPKNMNTYLALMVDELIHLYTHGFLYHDPYLKVQNRSFVKLLFTACDFPGHAQINCLQKQAATYGCHKCDLAGDTKTKFNVDRVTYGGFAGLARTPSQVPSKLTKEVYLARAHRHAELHQMRVEKKITSDTALKQKLFTECKQVKGLSELTRLEYFDIVEHTLLDLMHTVAGIVSHHLMPLVKGERLQKFTQPKISKKAQNAAAKKAKEAAAAIEGARRYEAVLAARAPPSVAEARKRVREQKEVEEYHEQQQQTDSDDDDYSDEDPHEQVDEDFRQVILEPERAVARPAAAVAAPAAAAAAAASVQQNHSQLNEFQNMYKISKADQEKIEQNCYKLIQAPGKVAPATKLPFTTSGYMTADNWLLFTKVFGKYLFKRHYRKPEQQRVLVAICHLLDLLALCSLVKHTTASKLKIAELTKIVATHFEKDFPSTEHAIVVHNLLFHVPDTINQWGPAVGYWCFPFER
jgi:hypothetical protein